VTELLNPAQFEQSLRAIGAERYHDKHPFHRMLHGGELRRGQVQAWALNRYCYQSAIPRKDAGLIARLSDPELRRTWLHRIFDHDGHEQDRGGIDRWLILTDGLGLDREYVQSQRGVLPAVKFAVEAYVRYTYENDNLRAIASSLTELFAPDLHRERIAGMVRHYDFIDDDVMIYGTVRLDQAPKDVAFALEYVQRAAQTAEHQQTVQEALRFKCDVLWAQLDAMYHAYVEPGHIPPGAFVPEDR
jgi:pyrroloquinoline-quinone synthase